MSDLKATNVPEMPVVPRETLEAAVANTPFAQLLGATLTHYAFGKVELSIPFTQAVTQHHGFAHGAVLGFLADSACAWAAASAAGDVVTAEYKINLLAPAKGPILVGRGEVIKVTGRQVTARAEVFSGVEGSFVLVAVALSTITRLGGNR
ncbi:PaaI family thioesterase [uncultured Sphingomonas sp.]|uniref:PaaI family thioesterase n=1 Tax=uncultured Sphingomonas sp. TaxID=158754 RepID=UPI0035CB0C96